MTRLWPPATVIRSGRVTGVTTAGVTVTIPAGVFSEPPRVALTGVATSVTVYQPGPPTATSISIGAISAAPGVAVDWIATGT